MPTKLAEKPSDADADVEAPKVESGRILKNEVSEALKALDSSAARLFVSGLSAGLDLGFSLFFMALVRSAAGPPTTLGMRFLTAAMYSFGFMIVVIGRSELFTEQTSLAALPVMTGEASVAKVARLWGIVYTANLVGAAAFAGITVVVGPAMGTIEPRVLGEIARDVVGHPWWLIVVSGMLAGWLMGLLSWLVAAGRDTISQLVMIWLITMAIGLGHFHHAVLGSVEMFAGLFSDPSIPGRDFIYAVGWTTLGNAVGGPLFILLKYGLARRGSEEDA